jgi:effector-binding domain-containing protein
MGTKILILAAFLFLALAALGAEPAAPGVPGLTTLPSQRMLVFRAQGDPDRMAGPAFDRLFKAFYAQAPREEKRHAPAPRARWASAQLDSAKSSWVGAYGVPVTETFPQPKDPDLRIETWEYGLTAQILHVGPYAAEDKDIAALKAFIAANGLAIAGPHEEEYVKGPGRLFKGNPAKYRTVIRYPVTRLGETLRPLAGKAAKDTADQPVR